MTNGERVRLSFRALHQCYSAEGPVVYSRRKAASLHPGYGIRFDVDPRTRQNLKKLASALASMGATQARDEFIDRAA